MYNSESLQPSVNLCESCVSETAAFEPVMLGILSKMTKIRKQKIAVRFKIMHYNDQTTVISSTLAMQ